MAELYTLFCNFASAKSHSIPFEPINNQVRHLFFAILSLQKFIFRVNFRLTRQHFCVKCTGIMRSRPLICPISLICFFGADTCIFVKDDPCKKLLFRHNFPASPENSERNCEKLPLHRSPKKCYNQANNVWHFCVKPVAQKCRTFLSS